MFAVRSERTVTADMLPEYEEYCDRTAAALEREPGLLRQFQVSSVDDPHRWQVYQFWENLQARERFARSSRWVRVPPGVLTGPADTGFFEVLAGIQLMEPEPGACVLGREMRVGNGPQREYESVERALCALAQAQPGFISRRILKFLGNDTGYVRLSVWRSWGALEHWRTTTEYQCENAALAGAVVWTEARRYRVHSVVP